MDTSKLAFSLHHLPRKPGLLPDVYLAPLNAQSCYVWADIPPDITGQVAPVFFMDIHAVLSFAWLLSFSM